MEIEIVWLGYQTLFHLTQIQRYSQVQSFLTGEYLTVKA
jgi:hypothetical protein